MKKIATLLFVLIFVAKVTNASTIVVTSSQIGDATTPAEGTLRYAILNAPENVETTIEFDIDGEGVSYGESDRITFAKKKLIFNGINKKTGKRIVISGSKGMFGMSDPSVCTFNDLVITGFKSIAVTMAAGAEVNANRCLFEKNASTAGNNGSILRINASTAVIKDCVFKGNQAMGSYGGGALCAYGAASLTVENSSFVGNVAVSGGAIGVNATANNAAPKVYIVNSTFANNSTDDRGGAIYMQSATAIEEFTPQIVNCTFVGNINGNDGGAICVWARATAKPMRPAIINNLFAENYRNAWKVNEEANDAWAYYLEGALDANNAPLAQTVFVNCKNNVYMTAQEKFFGAGNTQTTFGSIFMATEKNPLDEGDPDYNHQTSKLFTPMSVAMIAQDSPAAGAGISSVSGVVIPTKDQLGNTRPATPSVGAVEFDANVGVNQIIDAQSSVKVWISNKSLFVDGFEGSAVVTIFDQSGSTLKVFSLEQPGVCSMVGLSKGVYLAAIKTQGANYVAKIMVD